MPHEEPRSEDPGTERQSSTPRSGRTSRETADFAQTVELARPAAIRSLATRASKANRMAKFSVRPVSSLLAYGVKTRALLALLQLGPDGARIVEVLLAANLATVWVPSEGRCFHLPFDALDAQTRRLIIEQIGRALNAA